MFSRQHITFSVALILLFLLAASHTSAQEGVSAMPLRSQFISVHDTFFLAPGTVRMPLQASASSGLPVSWRTLPGSGGRISADTLYLDQPLTAGTWLSLEAYQGGDTRFRPANPVRVVIAPVPQSASQRLQPGPLPSSLRTAQLRSVQQPAPASDSEIDFYPNPFETVLSIHVQNLLQPAVVRVFDINGQLKATRSLTAVESPIDLSPLPKGVYMVQVQTGTKEYTRRVFKKN